MKKLLRTARQSVQHLALSESANTAEENSNRGVWWVVGIIVVATIAGVAWHVIGQVANGAQTAGMNVTGSVSTQSGLTTMTNSAEAGTATFGVTTSSSAFKAP